MCVCVCVCVCGGTTLRMKQMAAYSSLVTTKLFSIDTTKGGIEGFRLSFTVHLFHTASGFTLFGFISDGQP